MNPGLFINDYIFSHESSTLPLKDSLRLWKQGWDPGLHCHCQSCPCIEDHRCVGWCFSYSNSSVVLEVFWLFHRHLFLVYSKETLDHACQWHPLQTLLAVVLPSFEDIWTSRKFSWAGHNFEGYNAPIEQSAIYHSPWWLCKLIIWCWCWYSCPPAHTRETDNRFFYMWQKCCMHQQSENSQLDITNESQEASPFPAGDHKASINRLTRKHNQHKTVITWMIHKRSTALEGSLEIFYWRA